MLIGFCHCWFRWNIVDRLMIGGLSFLSPQYGWSVHSVVNYELILADGTITNVNEESNPGENSPIR